MGSSHGLLTQNPHILSHIHIGNEEGSLESQSFAVINWIIGFFWFHPLNAEGLVQKAAIEALTNASWRKIWACWMSSGLRPQGYFLFHLWASKQERITSPTIESPANTWGSRLGGYLEIYCRSGFDCNCICPVWVWNRWRTITNEAMEY